MQEIILKDEITITVFIEELNYYKFGLEALKREVNISYRKAENDELKQTYQGMLDDIDSRIDKLKRIMRGD